MEKSHNNKQPKEVKTKSRNNSKPREMETGYGENSTDDAVVDLVNTKKEMKDITNNRDLIYNYMTDGDMPETFWKEMAENTQKRIEEARKKNNELVETTIRLQNNWEKLSSRAELLEQLIQTLISEDGGVNE